MEPTLAAGHFRVLVLELPRSLVPCLTLAKKSQARQNAGFY